MTREPACGCAARAAARLVLTRPANLGRARLVAVDGPSGSGKTTFAAALGAELARQSAGTLVDLKTLGGSAQPAAGPALPAASPAQPAAGPALPDPVRASWLAAGAAHESAIASPTVAVLTTDLLATWEEPLAWWPRLEAQVLRPLSAGHDGLLRVTEWVSGVPRPGRWQPVPCVDVLVLEGVSAGRTAVAGRLSALIWVEVADPVRRLERAVGRDGEDMRRFLVRWQQQEAEHFQVDGTAARADLVVHPAA